MNMRNTIITKVLATVVAGVFFTNTVGTTAGASLIPAGKATLAPTTFFSDEIKQAEAQAMLLCKEIEQEARFDLTEDKLLAIRDWRATSRKLEGYRDVRFFTHQNERNNKEIFILADGKILIRYFDPKETDFAVRFQGDDNPNKLLSDEPVKGTTLQRQVYRIHMPLPRHYTILDVFKHIASKADMFGPEQGMPAKEGRDVRVAIEKEDFPVPQQVIPTCMLDEGSRKLSFHGAFERDLEDIQSANVGFAHQSDDGEIRWIEPARSIAYRVAMHEFNLEGREGRGHAYYDEAGQWRVGALPGDHVAANKVGRRYSVVDDALWLWYLLSYKYKEDETKDQIAWGRFHNEVLYKRMVWYLTDHDGEKRESVKMRRIVAREFPHLLGEANRERRQEAIRIALLMNRTYFIERRNAGIDTTPANEKDPYPVQRTANNGLGQTANGEKKIVYAGPQKDDAVVGRPYAAYTKMPEREITEREVERNAATGFGMAIKEARGVLEEIIAHQGEDQPERVRTAQEQREARFIAELREIYNAIGVDIEPNRPYRYYSEWLKALRAERERKKVKFEELESRKRDKKTTADTRRKLEDRQAKMNVDAIREYLLILKLQVGVAGMLFNGRSGLTSMQWARNAANAALIGAVTTTEDLEKELGFRISRLRREILLRETETTDWVGDVVKTIRLGGFNIEISGTEGEPKVSVRQRRWINVKTSLDRVLAAARHGNRERALEILEMLRDLYRRQYIQVNKKYKKVFDSLTELRDQRIRQLPDDRAPPRETIAEIRSEMKAIKEDVDYPKQWVWGENIYESLAASFRGQLKTVASMEIEIENILMRKANLEFYEDILAKAARRKSIAKRNRAMITGGVADIHAWAGRGSVLPKQQAEIELRSVGTLIAEDVDKFGEARGHIRRAVEWLERRIDYFDEDTLEQGLRQKIRSWTKRAVATFEKFRDRDIVKRLDRILKSAGTGEFEEALEEAQDIRELYFGNELVEPGYIRAEHRLRYIAGNLRGAVTEKDRGRMTDGKRDAHVRAITPYCDSIKEKDIRHKKALLIPVTFTDGSSEEFYFTPYDTVASAWKKLVQWRKRKLQGLTTKNVTVRIKGRIIKEAKWSDTPLRDEQPLTMTKGRRVMAGDGKPLEEVHTHGPGSENYRDGEIVSDALTAYLRSNEAFLPTVLGEDKEPIRYRVPIEILRLVDSRKEGTSATFLAALQGEMPDAKSNVVIEIFKGFSGTVMEPDPYKTYGIARKEFAAQPSKTNTITLFIPGEEGDIRERSMLLRRIGLPEFDLTNSVLMPVGRFRDPEDDSGLIRSTILGLRLMQIARNAASDMGEGEQQAFVQETIDQFRVFCQDAVAPDFDLSPEDITDLLGNNVRKIIDSLTKLIKLLPIERIDPTVLQEMYERAREVITAA